MVSLLDPEGVEAPAADGQLWTDCTVEVGEAWPAGLRREAAWWPAGGGQASGQEGGVVGVTDGTVNRETFFFCAVLPLFRWFCFHL